MMTIERLPILILYPHSRCNCRCVMCDIWKIDAVQEIIVEDLERHAADMEALGVEWVVFSGGEPLMHSDLFRLCERLRSMGIRTTILSTGLLLEKHARRIVESLDDVIVSLDGPPEIHDRIRRVPRAFDLLARGVRALHGLRAEFPVAARTTVQKWNVGRLRETIRTARDLGLRSISFLAADLTSAAFNRPEGWPVERQAEVALTPEELAALEEEIEAIIREEADGFILETPEKLRRIVRHFRAQLGLDEPVAPRCNAPWVSAVVESDGAVRPCFFHPPFGKLGEQSLREVLNSPRAVEFRRSLDVPANPICRRCVCSLYLAPDAATIASSNSRR
jgi:MoaA/NifB/PqqE/SkfB family radical SAM enzyme